MLRFSADTVVDTNFSIHSSKDVGRLEICFSFGVVVIVGASAYVVSEVRVTSSFPIIFYEKMVVVYFSYLVSSERPSVSDLR